MTNLPKMSKRAADALNVLANGGRFVERLERNSYTGREQFQVRLLATHGWSSVVSGIGRAAMSELKALDMLAYCAGEGTSVSTYWKMRTA